MFRNEYKRTFDENEPYSRRFVLDIDELLNSGIIVSGQTSSGRLVWINSAGELGFSVGYQSDMTLETQCRLTLYIFPYNGATSELLQFEQVIPLKKTASGGTVSYWFVDTEGRDSKVLYFSGFASATAQPAKVLSSPGRVRVSRHASGRHPKTFTEADSRHGASSR